MRSMGRCWSGPFLALAALLLTLPLAGCDLVAGLAPTPTPVPTPVVQVIPTATPTPVSTPTPAPTATPLPTATPYDLAKALGIPPLDTLLARSASLTEYSFNYKVMEEDGGPSIISGKAYVKGTKLRQELFVQGQRAIIFVDSSRPLYQILFSDQKTAVDLNVGDIGNQAVNPSESVETLRQNSQLVSAEIMHGESSAVYEITTADARIKYWIWIDKGLPLRIETVATGGQAILDFSDYHFGPQPDELFELPQGTKIVEAATNEPKLPDTGPAIPTPSRTY